MNILEEGSAKQEITKARSKTNNDSEKHNNEFMLFYRWLIFLFSCVLSITSTKFDAQGFAILESLAIVAIYNVAITAYILKKGKKCASSILYLDIMMLMLPVFFSGGIESELYVFVFFIIGLCGISNEIAYTLKTSAVSMVLYTVTCVMSGRFYAEGINYSTLIIRNLLFLMAAFAISKINYEVKKHDDMRKKEFRLARTDKLTGLANRHYFDQKLKEEVDYALTKDTVLNVLMFDLDNFKGFNDTYGHVSGDKLLVLFSDIIRQCVRKSDIPVRYGGEEFLILIRDLDIIIAKSVGDRIRRQLEKQRIYLGQQDDRQRVTVSCGVAQFPTHSRNIKEVIERADQALYHAKEIGKNIVVCYDESGQNRQTLENESAKR